MSDLIDRQTAIDALCKMRCGCVLDSCPLTFEEDGAEECADVRWLMSLPSAQPERKKGRWIPVAGRMGSEVQCDCCGEVFWYWIANYKYCPKCGAEMEVQHDH